jgi:hypothetical protein
VIATTRRVLTAVAVAWFAGVGVAVSRVPLTVLNLLLVSLAVPLVWLIWAFARWSAYQHADREAAAVRKVKGGRPVPLPHQGAVR